MSKEIIVKVKSKQYINGEEEVIELITPGKFYKREETYYAVYKETEISGMEGTTTTLKIDKDEMSLLRYGTTSSKMRFKKGVKDISLYSTPFGVVEIGVNPSLLHIDMDDDGGDISIEYGLETNKQLSSNNELHIEITQ